MPYVALLAAGVCLVQWCHAYSSDNLITFTLMVLITLASLLSRNMCASNRSQRPFRSSQKTYILALVLVAHTSYLLTTERNATAYAIVALYLPIW